MKKNIESFIENSGLKILISDAPPIKGVSNTHMMRSNGFDVKIFNTSNDAPHQNHTITVQEEGGIDDADNIDFQSSIQIRTSIRNGTFILVVYKYRKGKKENIIPKKLVAIVQNIGDVIDVAFCKALSKSRFKLDDEGYVTEDDILEVLSFPKCHRGVFQFEKDIDVDLF